MSSSHAAPADAASDHIAWVEWSAEPFARALAARRAVLLSIGARWCHGCAVMDRTTFADPLIVRAVNDRFVPVRVDADRRPDVNDRYNLEGWPTTVFLTPDGEMLAGSTYLTSDAFRQLADEVASAMANQYDALLARGRAQAAARARQPLPVRYEPDLSAPEWATAHLLAEHDTEFGGFGTGGKFLQAGALAFGLAQRAALSTDRLDVLLVTSLDAMLRSPIVDEVEGGFFRYASGRDWSKPHTEQMLEDQAAMLRVLAGAAVAFARDDYAERARRLMAFVRRTLFDPAQPGFFASRAADDDYYAVSGSIRDTMDPPAVDHTLFTDVNAQAAAAWIEAGVQLDDAEAIRLGASALDHVLSATYRPGEGVAHFEAGARGVRGLLTDQVHGAWAALELHDVSGDETWWMVAEELLGYALRVLWDETRGGFRDRAPGGEDEIGLLRDPLKPLALNCLAARALARLARVTGKEDLHRRALATLAAQTPVYRAQGLAGTAYAHAVLEIAGG